MADTYTWSVNTLDRELSDGVVYTVHWSLSATRPFPGMPNAYYQAGSYGSQGFTADPSDPGFVPYDQLTEAICIGWVQDALGTEAVTAMESGLSSQLDEKETPTHEAGVPWTVSG
jgi:hypothetical protein